MAKRRAADKASSGSDAAGEAVSGADRLALLATLDPALAPIVRAVVELPPRRSRAGFAGLAWIVVSQQVSVASANAIWARVEAAFPNLEPADIGAATDEALRACGLSAPKIRTLRAIADEIGQRGLDLDALRHADAETAIARLVAVKGVGPWTAEIFLMFCLGHADVFPAGDLALQEAARLAFGLEARPDANALRARADAWSPHRATAARLLWAYHKIAKGRAGMAGEADAKPAAAGPKRSARAPASSGATPERRAAPALTPRRGKKLRSETA